MSSNPVAHPAWEAWRRVGATDPGSPRVIEKLKGKRKSKSAVYRMCRAVGEPIIAKRCRRWSAEIERTVYTEILPRVPVPRIEYLGYVTDDDDAYSWIFLEDAGDGRPPIPAGGMIGTWLAKLHAGSRSNPVLATLPNRGLEYYSTVLEEACSRCLAALRRGLLSQSDRGVIESVVSQCRGVANMWGQFELACVGMPPSLVHGDLSAKNLRVRGSGLTCSLFVLDWEFAGRGIAAVDLGTASSSPASELDAYWAQMRQVSPQLSRDQVETFAEVGRVCRWVASVNWLSESLETDWVERSMRSLRELAGNPPRLPGFEGRAETIA